jgi:hypothetical protein
VPIVIKIKEAQSNMPKNQSPGIKMSRGKMGQYYLLPRLPLLHGVIVRGNRIGPLEHDDAASI